MSDAPQDPKQARQQVYLLHFDRPLAHARHYVGWCAYDLEQRLEHHVAGRGARLLQVLTERGIGFQVARVWPGAGRDFERRLKDWHGSDKFCPLCEPKAMQRLVSTSQKR